MTAPRALAALLVVGLTLSGCTSPSAPPPGGAAPTLSWLTIPTTAIQGERFDVTFRVSGGAGSITHAEVHFGAGIPTTQSEGQVVPATPIGADRYQASLTPTTTGTLHLRAHLTQGGKESWSDEATLTVRPGVVPPPPPGPTGPTFSDVFIAPQVEAGVIFLIRYHLSGSGTSPHVGAHLSPNSSAAMGEHFAPGDWPGMRASQHLGTDVPVTLPLDVNVQATLPWAGTWFVRPHALVGSVNHWGPEVQVRATNPQQPNIVLLDAPARAVAGETVSVRFSLNAQQGTSNHVGAHFSPNSSASLGERFAPSDWSGQRASKHLGVDTPVDVPGVFTARILFPLPGTWHYRAHAFVAATNTWSPEVRVEVTAPPDAKVVVASAPEKVRSNSGILGGRPDAFTVEWAVLTPQAANTTHTHVHHGPLSRPSPREGSLNDYPSATPVQQGLTPALYSVTVQPDTGLQGSYYLRAMAILRGDDGLPREVWSDEWVVELTP